jgi:hypothetical protein
LSSPITAPSPFNRRYETLNKLKETNQNDLYGNLAHDVNLLNNVSPTGQTIIHEIEKIVFNSENDLEMVKEVKKYAVTLEAAHTYVR